MLIQRRETNGKGTFFVEYEGEMHAWMIYHMNDPGKMVIEHTEVDDVLRGQNVGYLLVETAVEYARQHNIKITVWCPFAKSVFNKKPDWHDVLDK